MRERPNTALAVILIAAPAAAADHVVGCRAVDGDTLSCGTERVRLRAIHAPEIREPGGPEARARLARLIAGADVELVRHGTDRFGRTRADVYVDGRRITQTDVGPRGGRHMHKLPASAKWSASARPRHDASACQDNAGGAIGVAGHRG